MADFDESKVKRDDDGQFAAKDSGDTPAEKKKLAEFMEADEFRYIKKSDNPKTEGHPAHIYAKSDEQAKYLQMTHSQFIKDMAEANIELKTNPNPKDGRTAYVVPKSQISNLDDLGKVMKGWKLSGLMTKRLLFTATSLLM